MTVLEVKPHKVYIRDLVPYRTAVMFFMAAFLLFHKKTKKSPHSPPASLSVGQFRIVKTCFAVGLFTIPILSKKKG